MAHWAEIDKANVVLRVTVGDNNDPDEGYQWLLDNLGGTWVKTSYNATIRRQFAGIGDYYDEANDGFRSPSPFPSWSFDVTAWAWQAPKPYPVDSKSYVWDEVTASWSEVSFYADEIAAITR